MELRELARLGSLLVDEVERAVVGKREQLELILLGMLADGHVLLEDVPGLAKTLTARSFAEASGLGFSRVQFTPDLLPADVTGSSIWNQRDADFEFRSGPIFTHLLLADEINRAPPKTQANTMSPMIHSSMLSPSERCSAAEARLLFCGQHRGERRGRGCGLTVV